MSDGSYCACYSKTILGVGILYGLQNAGDFDDGVVFLCRDTATAAGTDTVLLDASVVSGSGRDNGSCYRGAVVDTGVGQDCVAFGSLCYAVR